MIDVFRLKVYWEGRKESVSECSQKLEKLFKQLEAKNSFFAQWSLTGESKKKALKSTFDIKDIEKYLRDSNSDLLDTQGYSKQGISMSLYKQDNSGNEYGLSFLGGYEGHLYPNNFIISFWDPAFFGKSEILELFETVVHCLNPEWGCVDSKDLTKQIGSSKNRIGWISLVEKTDESIPTGIKQKSLENDYSICYLNSGDWHDYNRVEIIQSLKLLHQIKY